jgi:hypothetical protein
VSSVAVPLHLETDRRAGRWAGAAAFASLAASIGALVAANAQAGRGQPLGSGEPAGTAVEKMNRLVDFHASLSGQTVAVVLRSVGLLLAIAVGVYLCWLVRRRGAPVGRVVLWSAVAGPVLVVGATVFGFLAFRDVADAFASGPQDAGRAARLIDDSGSLQAARVFDFASRIVFAIGIGVLSLHMMRLGLFTGFLGYWGIATSVALVLIALGDAMYVGWLASIAFLAVGYWPGGRPAAWDGAPPPARPVS